MLDSEQIRYLSDDEADRYKQIEKWFDAAPWSWIRQGFMEEIEPLKDRVVMAKSWDEACFLRGELARVMGFVNLQETVMTEFAARSEQNRDEMQIEQEEEYE